MKRVASILLLAILTFNWVGYRFVSNFLERRASLALNSVIDNDQYEQSSLIELRIPLNTPYLPANSPDFERYDGEVELNGIHYKYVKRKIENGELVLLCLPNETKTKFRQAKVDFFKLVNDLNAGSSSTDKSQHAAPKIFTAEYVQEHNSWAIVSLSLVGLKHVIRNRQLCSEDFSCAPERPPQA